MADLAYREVYAMNRVQARQLLLQTYEQTKSIRATAHLWHTARQVVRKWLRRYQEQDPASLQDRSRRPAHPLARPLLTRNSMPLICCKSMTCHSSSLSATAGCMSTTCCAHTSAQAWSKGLLWLPCVIWGILGMITSPCCLLSFSTRSAQTCCCLATNRMVTIYWPLTSCKPNLTNVTRKAFCLMQE